MGIVLTYLSDCCEKTWRLQNKHIIQESLWRNLLVYMVECECRAQVTWKNQKITKYQVAGHLNIWEVHSWISLLKLPPLQQIWQRACSNLHKKFMEGIPCSTLNSADIQIYNKLETGNQSFTFWWRHAHTEIHLFSEHSKIGCRVFYTAHLPQWHHFS